MKMKIKDVSIFILAGGRGKRFWPLSRQDNPKQFIPVFDGSSMLQNTYSRVRKIAGKENIFIITSLNQIGLIKKQLPNFNKKNLIIEPEPKGTAAAIGLGAIFARRINPNSIMIIVPADQYIKENDKFRQVLLKAVNGAVEKDALITVGVKPTFASCGYGYLKLAKKTKITNGYIYDVDKFTEKPSRKTALRYIKSGKYYFNSGMFIWKASVFLRELKKHMPGLYRKLMDVESKGNRFNNKRAVKKISSIYKKIRPISVDYGLMQKTDNIKAAKAAFKWSDLGSLASLEEIKPKKGKNLIIDALNISKDARDCLVCGKKDHLIATLGVSNLVIIQTGDVTLVADKKRIQQVKDIVDKANKDKKLKRFI